MKIRIANFRYRMLRRLVHRISVAVLFTMAAQTLSAGIEDLPVKEINGKFYHFYEVKPRETVYSLVRQLGITQDMLYETNPSTRDGLKAYSELLFPVQQPEISVSQVTPRKTHTVKKGETVYGISKIYGITTEEIFEWNPESINGIRTGETLIVSAPSQVRELTMADTESTISEVTAPKEETSSEGNYIEYVVRDKETFYSIARAHGISIHELEAANPDVGILKSGQIIHIPGNMVQEEISSEIAVPEDNELADTNNETEEVESNSEIEFSPRRNIINIALTIPVMADSENRSRQSDMYLDFYKGFLIAVDSMRHCGTPIVVRLTDTYGSNSSLNDLINSADFEDINVIIGPDSEEQLELLSSAAKEKKVFIFNPFVVKDETYSTNPWMMQANIPQSMMYDKAIDGVITRYADYLPVIVSHKGGADDKSGFIKRLKEKFSSAGIDSKEIEFDSYLELSSLMSLPEDQPLMIIPVSGKQVELNKILPTLVELKDKGRRVMVFGYPEWTTFRGETLKQMHEVGTVVYSRFFIDEEAQDTEALDGRFVYWYGKPMMNVLPRQGLLGFDAGMYLINALQQTRNDLSLPATMREGIQNGFHFIRPDNSLGMVNDMLFFINYRSDGSIDKIVL